MKLKKGKIVKGDIKKELKLKNIYHKKLESEDINNISKFKTIIVSKFLNQNNNINNKILTTENLPNLKTNIQNIFSNDDMKQRAIQYLMKIRKERHSSTSTDFKKLLTSDSKEKVLNKNENEKQKVPYKNKQLKHHKINKINKSNITPINLYQKNININHLNKKFKNEKNYSQPKIDYYNNNIFEDNPKYNNIYNNYMQYKYNDNFIGNNYNNSNHNSYNKISVNEKIKEIKKNGNKTYDNLRDNSNNPINNNENNYYFQINNYQSPIDKNNHNILKIKRMILNVEPNNNNIYIKKNTKTNSIDNNISFYNHKSVFYKKNNYDYNNNSNIKNKEIGNNNIKDYSILQINNTNTNNDKNNSKDKITNSFINKKILFVDNNKNIKNDIKQNFKIKFNDNALTTINTIQISINKEINNEKEDKNNINIFNSKFNNDKLIINNQIDFYIENINKKMNFDKEEEIIEYIKKKYDKEKLKKIFVIEDEDISINTGNNKNEFMTIEDGNRVKGENKQLLSEINKLKYENKQYKKELVDIRNQYNDLSKELNIIKEENEKLKDNIINNMINDDDNEDDIYNEKND